MIRRYWRSAVLIGAAGIGCAYFNGLYNANQLAGDAARAQREGRPGEARSLWAQAVVKAESVATRYPKSKYHDDALLLWGKGLAEIGDCNRAVRPLSLAVGSSADAALQREARLVLARCQLAVNRPTAAIASLDALLDGADSATTAQVYLLRGRAELSRGNPAAAVSDFERVPPDVAAFDLANALLMIGDVAGAKAVLATRAALEYRETPWLTVLDSLGRRDGEGAAELVDRLVERRDVTPGQRARLFNADGVRWERAGRELRARDRFGAAVAAAPDSADANLGRAYAGVARFRELDDLSMLADVRRELDRPMRAGGPSAQVVGPTVGVLDVTIQVVAAPELPNRDAKLFVLGEMVRDSLRAPIPAAALFLFVQREHRESPIAPKALLAAATLRPELADSLSGMMASQYPGSPYRLALRGEASERFASLEDSLKTLFAAERLRLRSPLGVGAGEEELIRRRR
ncbi:MAG: tetratricopeptide repeat protein [Gemmatimonadota bacterium]|nr:tetratricopeptide repeat protein [Gemmatimonadota bacterium]MDH3366422.1 tetratricopeptide repeat protein [Gemmatimonadota bacterium]MDH3478966.1 tetratricopeptide repeat protein [Gemmatimonadota bacterium]MDH3570019.1 tetratricopeptide repeat protein [Gemmatimonadota bacterium]MDH5551271.1 tetratricopeptide repeat protein [Gemmatimonadota bacterium]